jgi:hypothetical protein
MYELHWVPAVDSTLADVLDAIYMTEQDIAGL